MATVCCKLANSLTFSPPASGVRSISVQPATNISESVGTIQITGFSFDSSTNGPYLGIACGPFSIEASINWLMKRKCGEWSGSNITIPGNDSSLLFIPQINAAVTVKCPEDFGNASVGSNINLLPNAGTVSLWGYNSLGGPVDAVSADISSGLQSKASILNAYFFKRVDFTGIHEIYNFNTHDGTIDVPVGITIEGTLYKAYPQSFNLTIDPPSPATVSITYIFEDDNIKPLTLDNCGD